MFIFHDLNKKDTKKNTEYCDNLGMVEYQA